MRKLFCPICRQRIWRKDITLSTAFNCPNCNERLCAPSTYAPRVGYVSIVVGAGLAYFAASGLLSWLLLSIPLTFAVNHVVQQVIPPSFMPAPPE